MPTTAQELDKLKTQSAKPLKPIGQVEVEPSALIQKGFEPTTSISSMEPSEAELFDRIGSTLKEIEHYSR